MTKALLRGTRLLRKHRENFSLVATTENPQLALLPLSRAAMVLPAVRSVSYLLFWLEPRTFQGAPVRKNGRNLATFCGIPRSH